jgi:hypothetical protein
MGIAEWLGLGKTIKEGSEGIGGLVETTVSSITGELKPDDKAKIELLKLEVQKQAQEMGLKASEQFNNFILQYEGKAEDMPKVIQIMRALIRPVFSLYFLLVLFITFGIDFYNMLFEGMEGLNW